MSQNFNKFHIRSETFSESVLKGSITLQLKISQAQFGPVI